MLLKEDFRKIRRRCSENLNVTCGISLSKDIKDKISTAQDLYDLFDVTCHCKQYWNWMNIRVIEKMASKCQEAMKLIDQYKEKVFSKKVKEVISEIPNLEIPADKYTEVKEKWNKEYDDLMIKDVVKRWNEIEKVLEAEGEILFKNITFGCVEICWLIPNSLVEHAVSLATKTQCVNHEDHSAIDNQEFLSESMSFKIGDVVIKDAFTSKL